MTLACKQQWFGWEKPDGGGKWQDKVNWQLKMVCHGFSQWRRDHRVSLFFRGLTTNKLHINGAINSRPWLKMKAYPMAVFTKFLHHKFSSIPQPNSVQRQITTLLWGLNQAYNIIASPSTFLTTAQADLLEASRKAIPCCYVHLAVEFTRDSTPMFGTTAKMHRLDHCLRRGVAMKLNPGCWWTMYDEGAGGRISRIAVGTHSSTLPLRTVQRWLFQFMHKHTS